MILQLSLLLLASTPTFSEIMKNVPPDPPPEELTRGKHYVRSDEMRHDLFRPHITDKGGVYLGVGTNQNYLVAGWVRPSGIIIVDFDEEVVKVHDGYRALFIHAETPQEFLQAWKPRAKYRRKAFKMINDTYSSRQRRLEARRALLKWGSRVHRGLTLMWEEMQKQNVPCFLDDAAQYEHLRELFQNEQVLAIRGDFTADRTLKAIANGLKELDETVSVLYLSNIEQYIGWARDYRVNMLRLPFSEETVVLRAYGWGEERSADGNYRYYVQPGPLFRRWLQKRNTHYVRDFLRTEKPSGTIGFHEMNSSPEDAEKRAQR